MRPLLALFICSVPLPAADPPAVPREFRGAWVASVANIDWPSKPGLSADEQQKEWVGICDRCVALRLNAVVLQVRPMCDALYKSDLEPWSGFLTGTPGKDPGYDPLEFCITEAHARGLELHAWFNPYRAWAPGAKGEVPATHVVKAKPGWAKPYGKHHWLNPTNPEVSKHSLAVVRDVVKRYDVDGIHLDDYFYPYPELDADKKEIPFPDDDTWAEYEKDGGKLSRDDWRRAAVDEFVKKLYDEVHAEKKWVKVGISPFGIWKPGHPEGISGFDPHSKLYADAKKWLNEGWVDYYTPQLYWPIGQEKQSYPKLLEWWAGENTHKRHLWPGNSASRQTSMAKGWGETELADQIAATRKQKGAGGNIHFSMKALMDKDSAASKNLAKAYTDVAVVPASPWLGKEKPNKPEVSFVRAQVETAEGRVCRGWSEFAGAKDTRLFVVRYVEEKEWRTRVVVADNGKGSVSSRSPDGPARLLVTAMNRFGTESDPTEWPGK